MIDLACLVIVLMPLKLFQAEENAVINQIPNDKAIVLTGENNQKHTQIQIGTHGFIHLITSPEIALLKKFKQNVLDNLVFKLRLLFLGINEIHLVKKWGKQFCLLYAEIAKIQT